MGLLEYDLTLGLQALHNYRVKTNANHMVLSVACPAGPSKYQILDLQGMNQYLDFFNLMV